MRILVVDDDAVFREELSELLREEGHALEVAASVPKALEALEQHDFDVVLTDLKMPRHSGLELLEELRKRWPRTLVVMITGFATVETAVQAMKAGAFDYIRKPFQSQQVRQVIELAQQEMQFRSTGRSVADPSALAESWVRQEGREVILVSPRPLKAKPGVTVFSEQPLEPARIREAVESFVGSHPKPGVILDDAASLLVGRRREDVLGFVGALREKVEGRGPFVLIVDPTGLASKDLADLRAAVMAPSTHTTLELLANPLRRAVIRRAAQGACTFTQAMQAAGIDDSPKLSFHLRKLVEEGLLAHQGEEYRITPKGRESVRLLQELDAMSPTATVGNAVLEARRA